MSDTKISALTSYSNPDRTNDSLPIVDAANSTTKRISINNMLGLTSAPVGKDDTQTLTAKTLTAPTITSPILSGTITGTYTLAGTPTFPSSVATLTGAQTLTNKILTSPTISAPTITNASISADTVTGFSTSNSGTIYGIAVTAGVITSPNALPTGTIVQQVSTLSSAVATGTTVIPADDTIPQNTEGDQYMTLAITPKSTTNTLVISALVFCSSGVTNHLIVALFQDSTANALAAASQYQGTAFGEATVPLTHTMAAGTTSATTFKIRAGGTSAGTMTFNGVGGGRYFSTITKSSIVITEYKS